MPPHSTHTTYRIVNARVSAKLFYAHDACRLRHCVLRRVPFLCRAGAHVRASRRGAPRSGVGVDSGNIRTALLRDALLRIARIAFAHRILARFACRLSLSQ